MLFVRTLTPFAKALPSAIALSLTAALLLSGCGGGGTGSPAASSTATVTVDLSQAVAAKSMVGFLHSMNTGTPADPYITPLQPKLWRTGTLTPEIYPRAIGFHSSFVLVCSDYWGYDRANRPDYNFPAYQAKVTQLVQDHLGEPVIYDIWNEPNTPLFWAGDLFTFFQTFKIAHDAIRAVQPDSLISGPSYSAYDHASIQLFLNFCLLHKIKLDVLSWHEFAEGDQIPGIQGHLEEARRDFLQNARYAPLGIQKIQINETIGRDLQCKPASSLAILDQLERGGADAAAHACWDDPDGGNNCNENSLDGLLTAGGYNPRAVWWAYKAYSDGVATRVASSSTNGRFFSLASSSAQGLASSTPAPQLIVGMYQVPRNRDSTGTATLVFNHINTAASLAGASNVRLTIVAIPASEAAPLQSLSPPTTLTVPIQNDSVTATLPVGLEEAYVVSLAPA